MEISLSTFQTRVFIAALFLSVLIFSLHIRNFLSHFSYAMEKPLFQVSPLFAAEAPAAEETAQNEKEAKEDEQKEPEPKEVDLLNMTFEEFQMLSTLAAQHNEIIRKQAAFKKKEEALNILKADIQTKIEDLEKVEKRLQFLLKEQKKKEKESMRELVKVFESMKPQESASIFSRLEPRVLLMILQRMKGVKIAAILAQLPPDQAAKITAVMTDLAQGVGL